MVFPHLTQATTSAHPLAHSYTPRLPWLTHTHHTTLAHPYTPRLPWLTHTHHAPLAHPYTPRLPWLTHTHHAPLARAPLSAAGASWTLWVSSTRRRCQPLANCRGKARGGAHSSGSCPTTTPPSPSPSRCRDACIYRCFWAAKAERCFAKTAEGDAHWKMGAIMTEKWGPLCCVAGGMTRPSASVLREQCFIAHEMGDS